VHKFAGRVTPNSDFKGTPLFDVDYLRNGRLHRNINLIVTYALLNGVISHDRK